MSHPFMWDRLWVGGHLATLDPDAKTTDIDLSSGMDELKKRLEILLGTKPDVPTDESLKEQMEKEAAQLARKERVASAGGQLLGAAFSFIGEMFSEKEETEKALQLSEAFKERLLTCYCCGFYI